MSDKKFYVTTSIAYVNAPPHIGFALESLQADVLARYNRQKGEVFFLTGTDEHGAKIARAAEQAGETPKELTDKLSNEFKNLREALNLSWNNFVRTSDQKNHWPVAQEIWNKISEAGDLELKTYNGLYCVGCEAFITQKDLVDGKCIIHKTPPEKIEEKNWFFKLSKYGKDIKKAIEGGELKIIPESRKNEVLSFLKEGLDDISFSRPSKDLKWGVPVPNDDSQTMYVWADALTNYISGCGGVKAWVKHPADVHVIGKDILRFHAMIWPAMLLSAKLSLPKSIFVHGFITVDGQKMSKSVGNVIDPFELVKKYGIDAVRYFLLREIPSAEDGDFSYDKFKERYNGDLANGLGNLVARVATIGEKLGDIKVKKGDKESINTELIEAFEFNKALEKIWNEIHVLDKKINDEKPWMEKDEEILKNNIAIYSGKIISIAEALEPFLPDTSKEIRNQFKFEKNILSIKKGKSLFPRL
ncbi:MAG: methionine--tRNA ligase [Candidatus Pacebacteria bacterium]|nr:methionine--tRNA ligase [Candidatus Paceibacterota bacterium]